MFSALFFSAVTAAISPAASADDGWLAWQGCWRSDQDAPSNMLCIVPTQTGARLVTYVNEVVQDETEVVADGVDRPVEQEGCKGTQRARWSQDGKRLFLTSNMVCGQNINRTVHGIMSFTSTSSWLSVQTVASAGFARVLRYRAVDDGIPEAIAADLRANKLARETARYSAVALLGLDDVKEAVANVDAKVVADWLTEAKQMFALNAKNLVELADAGVPAAVIDVMIAVSHPELFAVRTVREYDARDRTRAGVDSCYDPFYDPWYSYGYGYNRCHRYGYGRYGTLFGYDSYGWHTYREPIIIVRGGGTVADGARVTRQGYKGPRTSETAGTAPHPSSTTRSSGSAGSSSSSGSSGESSSGSGGGRTAKPRGT